MWNRPTLESSQESYVKEIEGGGDFKGYSAPVGSQAARDWKVLDLGTSREFVSWKWVESRGRSSEGEKGEKVQRDRPFKQFAYGGR